VAGAVLGLVGVTLWGYVRVALTVVLHRVGVGTDWSWYTGESFGNAVRGLNVGTVLAFVGATVLAEETVFRGIILPRLRRITGHWWSAVLICSLFFGAYHWSGGVGLVVATSLISVACCVVFIRSRSLVAAALAHFLYNMTLYAVGNLGSAGSA
jgi:membrane protease YdiL (CAAX protease family)